MSQLRFGGCANSLGDLSHFSYFCRFTGGDRGGGGSSKGMSMTIWGWFKMTGI